MPCVWSKSPGTPLSWEAHCTVECCLCQKIYPPQLQMPVFFPHTPAVFSGTVMWPSPLSGRLHQDAVNYWALKEINFWVLFSTEHTLKVRMGWGKCLGFVSGLLMQSFCRNHLQDMNYSTDTIRRLELNKKLSGFQVLFRCQHYLSSFR